MAKPVLHDPRVLTIFDPKLVATWRRPWNVSSSGSPGRVEHPSRKGTAQRAAGWSGEYEIIRAGSGSVQPEMLGQLVDEERRQAQRPA